jgi:beta-mannosidase
MFHPHRFDLRGLVREGANELSITFRSPLKHIREEQERLGKRPVNGDWEPYIYIRKAACNFGWDWAPKLATCGVWKSIGLEAWSTVRIARARTGTRRNADGSWELDVAVDLEWSGTPARGTVVVGAEVDAKDEEPAVIGSAHDVVTPGTASIRHSLSFSTATEWSPRGMGGRQLYPLEIWVTDNYETNRQAVDLLDQHHSKFGFRDVKLKTDHDEHGSAFVLEVNGRKVFCKGANWIPDGPWAGQVSRETYKHRLQQAAAANMNMLRVWGGGCYESDDFYELCDELGIMVWQDFMFSCAMYPEEQPYPRLIEAEARHQIARLSAHPSVVLWCGGNECTWAHDEWGNTPGERPWKERLGGKSWGLTYYKGLLPSLLYNSETPYWPNSPYPMNNADHGDRHTWDKRGDGYRDVVPRFCSEFGQQSPSNYATLVKAVGAEALKLGSAELGHRQRATGGTARHIDEAIAETFRQPRDFDEWHYLAQLTQARAMKTGIEWLRVNRPRCMGALVWQLNECWPGMSWSLVDSEGRGKLAYHAVKEAFRERLITIQPFEGRPWLWVVNDDEKPSRYIVDLKRMDFDANVLASARVEVGADGGNVSRVCDVIGAVGDAGDPAHEFIIADAAGHRAAWFFLPDRELGYPRAEFASLPFGSNVKRGFKITARSVTRDLCVVGDRLKPDANWWGDQSPRLLLPGESLHVSLFPKERGTDAGIHHIEPAPPVLWCANGFGAGHRAGTGAAPQLAILSRCQHRASARCY